MSNNGTKIKIPTKIKETILINVGTFFRVGKSVGNKSIFFIVIEYKGH